MVALGSVGVGNLSRLLHSMHGLGVVFFFLNYCRMTSLCSNEQAMIIEMF